MLKWEEKSKTQELFYLIAHLNIKKENPLPIWKWWKNLIWLMLSNKKWKKLLSCVTIFWKLNPMLLSPKKVFPILLNISSLKETFPLLDVSEKPITAELQDVPDLKLSIDQKNSKIPMSEPIVVFLKLKKLEMNISPSWPNVKHQKHVVFYSEEDPKMF